MRIGIVCPYSLDRPGGVQLHVTDLAEALIERGHEVSVLAPAAPDTPVPYYVQASGRSFPVNYNGSTARLTFGLLTAARVRKWLRDGNFDVVHLHEPSTMSLSVIAMWARLGPTVATFHTSNEHSRLMRMAKPFIKPGMEELDARIAVSASADRTMQQHLRLAATHVIPNGVDTSGYVDAQPKTEWQGSESVPTVGILGRMDETRKGLHDFLAMIPAVRAVYPRTRFLVAGRFSDRVAAKAARAGAEIVGELQEEEKEVFMSSVDIYCAPNTGGESFGIVLVEAMAAGAAVVASDLVAFKDVATNVDGVETVAFHRVNDANDLGTKVIELLRDPEQRRELATLGQECAKEFDWDVVAPRVLETYRDAIRMDAEFHPHQSKEAAS